MLWFGLSQNGPWPLVISDREPQVPPEGSRRETALVDG